MIHSYCFFLMIRRPPRSTRTDTLFPTRRSSDLWNFHVAVLVGGKVQCQSNSTANHIPASNAHAVCWYLLQQLSRSVAKQHPCTCAIATSRNVQAPPVTLEAAQSNTVILAQLVQRSEERRVGKECVRTCRSRWSTYNK